ncbi:MAG: hypothetical protein K2F74_01080 [Muribaculaceae bacterium]|nr:hypothetical protein [Muribaculaceae bacterium]
MKKISISQDGVIYSVNPDNTITRYGRISPDGQLEKPDGTPAGVPSVQTPVRRRPVWGYWLVIILLLLGAALGVYAFMHQLEQQERTIADNRELRQRADSISGALRQKEQTIDHLQRELAAVNRSRFEAEHMLDAVGAQASSVMPLLVTDITFRNIRGTRQPQSGYGTALRASDLRYLQAKVDYYGLVTGMRTFSVRVTGPNGPLGNGDYAFRMERPVEKGGGHSFELVGFGYAEPRWPPGSYRYEIWYGESLIARRTFKVI